MGGLPESLCLSARCQLRCLGCVLDPDECVSDEMLTQCLDDGVFFDVFRPSSQFHLYGGDPVLNPLFFRLVTFLSSEQRQVTVWLNGASSLDDIRSASVQVSRWMIYMPVFESQAYQMQVGSQALVAFESFVDDCVSEGLVFCLHHRVCLENLALLPELVQFAFDKGVDVLFHYCKSDFSRAQRRDIHYFERHRFVRVLALSTPYGLGVCQVPVFDRDFYFATVFSAFRSGWRRMQRFFRL